MSNLFFNIIIRRSLILNNCNKITVSKTNPGTCKFLSIISQLHQQNQDKEDTVETKKSTKSLNKITLISSNQSSITTLEDAQKLSKRRDLKLIKVEDMDPKTQRPIYKMVTASEFLSSEIDSIKDNEERDTKNLKKHEKLLTIGSKITDNDLSSKIKNIGKWLTKKNEVRILIQCSSSDDIQNGEKVFEKIEAFIKTETNGRIVQKRVKSSIIRFSIMPNKNAKET